MGPLSSKVFVVTMLVGEEREAIFNLPEARYNELSGAKVQEKDEIFYTRKTLQNLSEIRSKIGADMEDSLMLAAL